MKKDFSVIQLKVEMMCNLGSKILLHVNMHIDCLPSALNLEKCHGELPQKNTWKRVVVQRIRVSSMPPLILVVIDCRPEKFLTHSYLPWLCPFHPLLQPPLAYTDAMSNALQHSALALLPSLYTEQGHLLTLSNKLSFTSPLIIQSDASQSSKCLKHQESSIF